MFGVPTGCPVSFSDGHSGICRQNVIEELQQRIEDLRAAVQARDDFIAIAAHELRNPMTPIASQVDLLVAAVRRGDLQAGVLGGWSAWSSTSATTSGGRRRCWIFRGRLPARYGWNPRRSICRNSSAQLCRAMGDG